MHQFDRVLNEGEQILWTGQPRFGPWVVDRVALSVVIGVFGWIMIAIPLIASFVNPENVTEFSIPILITVGLCCQIPLIWTSKVANTTYKKYAYGLTTERLLFQKPGRGGSFDIISLPFNEVKDMQLNQGLTDLLFGGNTKSVLFSTESSHVYRGRRYGWEYKPERFDYVTDAENVLRFYESQQSQSAKPVEENTVAPSTLATPLTSSPFLPQSMEAQPASIDNLPKTITAILKPHEQVLWSGRPKRIPFILHYFILHAAILLYLGFATWSALSDFDQFLANQDKDSIQGLLAYVFLLVAPFVYRVLVYRRVYYVVTDHRVLVQSGAVGIDIESFEREQITDVAVKGGFLDAVFGGGSATVVLETYNRRATSNKSLWWKGNELQHIQNAGMVQSLLRPSSEYVVARNNNDMAAQSPTG